MKLPGGDKAVIDDGKLVDYCLSTTHPRGRHKARMFTAATGITLAQAGLLRDALEAAAREEDALPTRSSEFGQIYEIRFPLTGPTGTAEILSVWIVSPDDDRPRLVTCYPV